MTLFMNMKNNKVFCINNSQKKYMYKGSQSYDCHDRYHERIKYALSSKDIQL